MPGICMSSSATWWVDPAAAAARRRSSAIGPSGASSASMPQTRSCSRRKTRLVALSSTMRARAPRRAAVSAAGSAAPSGTRSSRTVNRKVLPCPGSLSTPISPPISSTSRRQIASPSPVPPNFRVVELSAWLNGWKSRARASGVMPTPLSRTATWSSTVSGPSCATSTVVTTSPRSVNLMAFPSRLMST